MYHSSVTFVKPKKPERMVFLESIKYLERACQGFEKLKHLFAEAYCHKVLMHVKKKTEQSATTHQEKYMKLMKSFN